MKTIKNTLKFQWILLILYLKGKAFPPQVQPQCLSRAPAIAPCARDSRWHIRATLDWPPWLRGIISQHSPRRSRATKRLGRRREGQGRLTRGKRNLGSDPWGGVPANPEPWSIYVYLYALESRARLARAQFSAPEIQKIINLGTHLDPQEPENRPKIDFRCYNFPAVP